MARRPTVSGEGQAPPTPTLGDALGDFLRGRGLGAVLKHPEIYGVWREVVGPEIAAHTRVLGLRRGRLEVGVDSSALMTDIQFHRATLLEALRRKVRKPLIWGVSFVLKPMQVHDGQQQED